VVDGRVVGGHVVDGHVVDGREVDGRVENAQVGHGALRESMRTNVERCQVHRTRNNAWAKCVCISKGAIGEIIEEAAADVHKEVQHSIRRLCVCTYKARAQVSEDVSIGTSDKTGAILF
jgi:hypothetical protein